MKRTMIMLLALSFGLGGCSLFGGSGAAADQPAVEDAATQDGAMPAAAPEPEPAAKKSGKAKPGKAKPAAKVSEAQARADLEAAGRRLVAQAARTVRPSKAARKVAKVGNEFVATYVEVDQSSMRTELRPGATGHHVGLVRYSENVFECRGASKAAALAAPCRSVRGRSVSEMLAHDGRKWLY